MKLNIELYQKIIDYLGTEVGL